MSTLATPRHKMRGRFLIIPLCLIAVVLMSISLVAQCFYVVRTETAFYTETKLELEVPSISVILTYLGNLLPILMLAVYCLFLHKFPKASFLVTAMFLVLFIWNTITCISLIFSEISFYLSGIHAIRTSFYTTKLMELFGFSYSFFYYSRDAYIGFSLITNILKLLCYGTIGISLLVAAFGSLNGFTKKMLVLIPLILATLTVVIQNLWPWLASVIDAIQMISYWNGPISYMSYYKPYAPLWCLYGNRELGYVFFLLAIICFVSMNMIFPIRKKPVTAMRGSAEKKLKMLNKQLKAGIITEEDFEAQRAEIVRTL